MSRPPSRPRPHVLASSLRRFEQVDAVATPVGRLVRERVPAGSLKDWLSGTWLGHALHPVLTDIPIGTWTSATLLDLLGGRAGRPAARRLIGIGITAAVPTALTGATEWADTETADDEVRRVGAVHAATNVAALGLYSASLGARRRGRPGLGAMFGLAGLGALVVGGHLGGHLSYAKAVGVARTAWSEVVEEWTDACAEADVAEGGMTHAEVAGMDVVVARRDGQLFALVDRCSHRGGDLHAGQLVDGCVQCPLHGSRFRLEDGSVERGPSAYPQPVFDVRVRDGRVEVRTPEWALQP
jgi:nitrite reductase/ring-hydroxylating ferredoxin subunit